jgi:hypothetical protein
VFPAIETAIEADIPIVFQWVRRSSQATQEERQVSASFVNKEAKSFASLGHGR